MIKTCILIFVLLQFYSTRLSIAKRFIKTHRVVREVDENVEKDFKSTLHELHSLLRDPIDEEHDELGEISDKTHAHEWTIQINSDEEKVARELADRYGFDHVSKVEGVGAGVFRFTNTKRDVSKKDSDEDIIESQKRDKNSEGNIDEKREALLSELSKRLSEDERIKWYKRERIFERDKRIPPIETANSMFGRRDVTLDDPQFPKQWYIKNDGQTTGPAKFDSNIVPVWDMGYTGKGVTISVLDDGIDHTHPDLVNNYDTKASKDLNGHDNDPFPNDSDPYNAHGTKCSGTIAAAANNSLCGVGIAFNSNIGAIRMLDGKATDGLEADALSFHRDHIDIYSCSWGPKDNGKTFGRPGRLGRIALAQGAKYGRRGLGSLFVWATGNGGRSKDDCNADGYVNSIYTMGIGSVNEHGVSTYYGEKCSAMFAVTYCSGRHKNNFFTKDAHADVITTYLHHQCTKHFVGTSSAAPLAAGIFALVLEANPMLSWRDMQHLIFHTTKVTSPLDSSWQKNGCGKPVNPKFGFGLLDAHKLVMAALTWKTVAPQRSCHFKLQFTNGDIPSRRHFKLNFTTDGCQSCKDKDKLTNGKCKNAIEKLEHVVVDITLKHRRRGDLSINLISPHGTVSPLLRNRIYDSSSAGLKGWKFLSVFNWCENPAGTWQLVFQDNSPTVTRPTRDYEEDYINYLDKEKKRVEQEREAIVKKALVKKLAEGMRRELVGENDQGSEDTSKSVNADVEKQVYGNADGSHVYKREEASEDENEDESDQYHNYDMSHREEEQESHRKRDNYFYARKKRAAEKKSDFDVDEEDEKRMNMFNNEHTIIYRDPVLKKSVLAGEVTKIAVTFYGTA